MTKFIRINVGVVAESIDDIGVLRIFCYKILQSTNFRIVIKSYNELIANGQISPLFLPEIEKFIQKSRIEKWDFLIIATDLDTKSPRYRNILLQKIINKISLPVVLALPNKTIEDWLIDDLHAVKMALPSANIITPERKLTFNAKDWLARRIGEYGKGLLPKNAYRRIAYQENIIKIRHGFEEFSKDLSHMVEQLYPTSMKINRIKLTKKEKIISRLHPWLPKNLRRSK